jgi:hypothetical protein
LHACGNAKQKNKAKQNKKIQTKFEDVDFNIDMNTISKVLGSRKTIKKITKGWLICFGRVTKLYFTRKKIP